MLKYMLSLVKYICLLSCLPYPHRTLEVIRCLSIYFQCSWPDSTRAWEWSLCWIIVLLQKRGAPCGRKAEDPLCRVGTLFRDTSKPWRKRNWRTSWIASYFTSNPKSFKILFFSLSQIHLFLCVSTEQTNFLIAHRTK